MKHNMKLLILLFSICCLQSCTDSLGIDPKYQVGPLYPEETLGESSPNQFSIDSLLSNLLSENFMLDSTLYPDNWSIVNKFAKSDIKMDTTNSKVRIWMKLNISNPSASNPISPKRKDRILAFQISFKAILQNNKSYILDGNRDSWKWASVLVESKSKEGTSSFKTYDGNQISSYISFIYTTNNNIDIKITLNLTPLGILETQTLEGQFTIPPIIQ